MVQSSCRGERATGQLELQESIPISGWERLLWPLIGCGKLLSSLKNCTLRNSTHHYTADEMNNHIRDCAAQDCTFPIQPPQFHLHEVSGVQIIWSGRRSKGKSYEAALPSQYLNWDEQVCLKSCRGARFWRFHLTLTGIIEFGSHKIILRNFLFSTFAFEPCR